MRLIGNAAVNNGHHLSNTPTKVAAPAQKLEGLLQGFVRLQTSFHAPCPLALATSQPCRANARQQQRESVSWCHEIYPEMPTTQARACAISRWASPA